MRKARVKNLSDKIPIYKIEKKVVVSRASAISCVMEIFMPEAYSVSSTQIDEYYELFNRVVKAIPSGYIIHKQDYYNRKTYEQDNSKVAFLAKSYEAKFHGREYLDHRSYLVITKHSYGDKFVSHLMTTLITGRLIRKEIIEGLDGFRNTILKVQHLLKGGGIGVKILGDVEVKNLLNRYFNFGNSRILNDLVFEKDSIRIGRDDLVVYNSVSAGIEMPGELDSEENNDEYFDRSFTYWLGIGLQVPHIVNTIIRKNDPGKLVKQLGGKREKISSMSFRSRKNEQLVEEYDAFLEEQVRNGQSPVYVSQNVMLWGHGEKLNGAENELNNALTKMDVYVQRNINCAAVYWACTPGNIADLGESEYQIQFSDAASMYIPIETNPKSVGVEGIKLSERDFGIPITLDMWDRPMETGQITNRNMFILGPSGSGKSFFTNFMVGQLLEQGYHITIIDVGGSYEKQCRLREGKYFEYTKDNKMSFNPFFITAGETKTLEEQESLKTLIFTIWKGEEKEVSKEEYTILSSCIGKYYEYIGEAKQNREGLAVNFNSFYEYVLDNFARMISDEEARYFNLDSFRIVLKPYYRGGEYDYLLNSAEEFSIAKVPFCVFELDEIKDHKVIFPVVALVIMESFITKMRQQKEIKKMILIEEAWKAVSSPAMAEFLKYLYKTVRKFNGAVGVITQEIEDIVGNEFLKKTILDNAEIQILLDQTKYKNRFGEITKLMGLQASEIKKIMSINKMPRPGERFKDAYIRLGSDGQVYSVLVSDMMAVVFSTDAAEVAVINRMIREEGDIIYAVEKYIYMKKEKLLRA